MEKSLKGKILLVRVLGFPVRLEKSLRGKILLARVLGFSCEDGKVAERKNLVGQGPGIFL
ncbi:MAG: hypothetical protein PUB40_00330 [Lachnospiraceae bacterium]|nr:hypothetical protein [Lachnospiraceae bacterium]